MIKSTVILAAVCLAIAGYLSPANAQEKSAIRAFFNGNRLLEFAQAAAQRQYVTAYVVGVVDSTHLVDYYRKGHTICEPTDITQDQMRDIVIKYLNDNPSVRHLNAAELVVMAIKESFPCAPSR